MWEWGMGNGEWAMWAMGSGIWDWRKTSEGNGREMLNAQHPTFTLTFSRLQFSLQSVIPHYYFFSSLRLSVCLGSEGWRTKAYAPSAQ